MRSRSRLQLVCCLARNESHDHVNSPLFCDIVEGIQGAGHGVSRSAEERDALQRAGARAVGLAWSCSRSAEEHAVVPRSCLVSHATAGESERIIGLRESDYSSSVSLCSSHNSRIHGVSSRVGVGPFFLLCCWCFCFLLLCMVLVPRVVHCLLLLCHACLWMFTCA